MYITNKELMKRLSVSKAMVSGMVHSKEFGCFAFQLVPGGAVRWDWEALNEYIQKNKAVIKR